VGIESPVRQVHLQGNNAVFRMDRDTDSAAFMLVRTAAGNFSSIYKTFVVGVNAVGANNGRFVINDLGTALSGDGTRRFTISSDGRIGNFDGPVAGLHVRNPMAGDILRLDSTAGTKRFAVADNGDVYARGADLELRRTNTTSGGYRITSGVSTLLADTGQGDDEESFLALNGDGAILCNPGDTALLTLLDTDDHKPAYILKNTQMQFETPADFTIACTNQQASDQLILKTTGEEIWYVADSDGDTLQTYCHSWYCNGTGNANKRMGLDIAGNLFLDANLTQNTSFDLAEAFWKSDPAIEAGDVVRVDPAAPNAVVLARQANDPAVVGVISTDPGIVMGGGAFCTNKLVDLWGEEVAALFAKERGQIEAALMATDTHLQACAAQLARLEGVATAAAKAREKPEDVARAEAEYASEQQQLADALEERALRAFCERHLAKLSLAGRVPVKVDASYGSIRPGDALVASDTPGRAMRAEDPAPGTVIGKALEPCAAGQGLIMMLVMNR
jgi:hypothetical protein